MTAPERTALYRLYDENDQLLYVGVTSCPEDRWKFHRQDKDWWPQVRMREIEWMDSRIAALAQEAVEIAARKPLHNTHGGWQYLLRPRGTVPPPGPYVPARGSSKLPTPSREELEALHAAIREVRDECHRGSQIPDEGTLPDHESRVRIRRYFGLGQERFSSVVGVNTIKSRSWENGTKEPAGWDRIMYARALHVMEDAVRRRTGPV